MIKLKRKRPQLRRYGPASKFGVKNKCPESTQNVFIKDRIMLGLVNTLSSLIPADTPLLGASLLPASTHRKSISPIRIYCCILRLDTKHRFHHHYHHALVHWCFCSIHCFFTSGFGGGKGVICVMPKRKRFFLGVSSQI